MTDDLGREFVREIRHISLWWLALATLGVCVLYFGATQARLVAKQRNWPTVTGTAFDAEFLDKSDPDVPATPELKVVCEYQVAGETYRSNLYTTRLAEFDVIPECFRKGAQVAIYYDPADPGTAVLEQPSMFGSFAWMAMGSLLAFVSGWAIISDIRQYLDLRMRTKALHEARHALFEMEDAVEKLREIGQSTRNQDLDGVIEDMNARLAGHKRSFANLRVP